MNNWLRLNKWRTWWKRKLQNKKVQKILNLKVQLRFQTRLKIQLGNLRVWAIAKAKTLLNRMTPTPLRIKAQALANRLVTLKKEEVFNTGLVKTQSKLVLVFHSLSQSTKVKKQTECYQLTLWKNIWKRKWEEEQLQLLTNQLIKKMTLEVQVDTLMKILNLFLKVKVINFQVLEAETKNLML